MGACGSTIDEDDRVDPHSRSISISVQGSTNKRSSRECGTHPTTTTTKKPQQRSRISWNARQGINNNSSSGAQWTEPLSENQTPNVSGLGLSSGIHLPPTDHQSIQPHIHSRSNSHAMAYTLSAGPGGRLLAASLEEKSTATLLAVITQSLPPPHQMDRRPSHEFSVSQSHSYTPKADVQDCTEIEHYYNEDCPHYQEYVRRWEASREAEQRDVANPSQPGGRSLFFGLQLMQAKLNMIKQPAVDLPASGGTPPSNSLSDKNRPSIIVPADEMVDIDFPASVVSSPRGGTLTPTCASPRADASPRPDTLLVHAFPNRFSFSTRSVSGLEQQNKSNPSKLPLPIFSIPHIAQSSLIDFMQELVLHGNSSSVASTRFNSPLLGPQPSGLFSGSSRHSPQPTLTHPHHLSSWPLVAASPSRSQSHTLIAPSLAQQTDRSVSPLPLSRHAPQTVKKSPVIHRRGSSTRSSPNSSIAT